MIDPPALTRRAPPLGCERYFFTRICCFCGGALGGFMPLRCCFCCFALFVFFGLLSPIDHLLASSNTRQRDAMPHHSAARYERATKGRKVCNDRAGCLPFTSPSCAASRCGA